MRINEKLDLKEIPVIDRLDQIRKTAPSASSAYKLSVKLLTDIRKYGPVNAEGVKEFAAGYVVLMEDKKFREAEFNTLTGMHSHYRTLEQYL